MRAKAIAQYNLATAHAIRGEYDKAGQNLGEVGQACRKSIWFDNQLHKIKNFLTFSYLQVTDNMQIPIIWSHCCRKYNYMYMWVKHV